MGSLGAMKARSFSKDRYFQGDVEDVAAARSPRGSRVASPTRGRSAPIVHQLVGGLRQAMGYCGAATIDALQEARFVRITGAGSAREPPARRDDHEGSAELPPWLSPPRFSTSPHRSRAPRIARCSCSTSAGSTAS